MGVFVEMKRLALAAFAIALLSSRVGFAQTPTTTPTVVTAAPVIIEPDQTRLKRPLVLDDGVADLHVGLGMTLSGEPKFSVADVVHMPIGADVGIGDTFEVGGLLNLALNPEVGSSLTARARVNLGLPHKMLALGMAMTLPFWWISDRLGPHRALPLAFEIPAFRFEGSQAAVQAVLRWIYVIQEGPNAKALDLGLAGIFRINKDAFAHLELGSQAADLKSDNMSLFAGLGLGTAITPNFIGKIQLQTGDVAAFSQWEVLIMIVNTSGGKAHSDSEWN
jgi:hypothetical protein